MPAYMIGNVRPHPDGTRDTEGMAEYHRRIQATLDPFGGRFVVRGGTFDVVEGDWYPDNLSIVEFPSADHFHRWYASDAYQQILALRTDNVHTDLVIVE